MGKTNEFIEYYIKLDKNQKNKVDFIEVMNEFQKLCEGEITEENLNPLCKVGKKYGLSFTGEDNLEIGSLSFNDVLDYKKFCETLEDSTTTFEQKGFPKIKFNNISDPYPFFSYSLDGKNYSNITREEFISKFPEYPLGNVDSKPVVRCIYGNLSDVDDIDRLYMHEGLEIKYYGYDERSKIKPGYTEAEFGFLVNIAGNEVFVYSQKELKELLNSLCMGEEDLCEEKVLVKEKRL